MRDEKGAVDAFAAYMNVGSMSATESNFAELRKEIDRAEQRVIKEIRMKKMGGVSVGLHPYFGRRGSYDGEKMVVALRIAFSNEGERHYGDIVSFLTRLGFIDKAMSVASTGDEAMNDVQIASSLLSVVRDLVTGKSRNAARLSHLEKEVIKALLEDVDEFEIDLDNLHHAVSPEKVVVKVYDFEDKDDEEPKRGEKSWLDLEDMPVEITDRNGDKFKTKMTIRMDTQVKKIDEDVITVELTVDGDYDHLGFANDEAQDRSESGRYY